MQHVRIFARPSEARVRKSAHGRSAPVMEAAHTDVARAGFGGRALGARTLGLLMIAALLLTAAGAAAGRRLFEEAALDEKRQTTSFAMAGNAAALQTKLQKFRLVPLALSTDPELRLALETPTEELRLALNRRFEEIAAASDAAAIYLVDRTGVTFAASNYRSARSFIGQDYSFRNYFQKALENRDAEEFAFGTVSGEAGLYLSRGVLGDDGETRGVIVLKLRFKDIESYWRNQERLILAMDGGGRIVVTPVETLRFKNLAGAPQGVLAAPPPVVAGAVGDGPVLATAQPIAEAGWTIVSFEPLRAALATPRLYGAVTGASVTALALGALTLLLRRLARNARKAREVAAYRAHLERAVAERTRELQSSYAQLSEETGRRVRAQESLRVMQDEIAQLNRLAILGQLSAKFAHEINQPLAAMRNYVDSSAKLLAAGARDDVAQNLEAMSGLVMRAARITAELRAFSRKRPSISANIEIGRAIDGALLIASPALTASSIAVDRDAGADGALVKVDPVRIEQVILNVIQNAVDALKDRPDSRIRIESRLDGARVVVRIADNGPGVANPGALFVPFQSEKESGLGLGLSISREILLEFGGEISYGPGEDGGAAFDIALPRSGT